MIESLDKNVKMFFFSFFFFLYNRSKLFILKNRYRFFLKMYAYIYIYEGKVCLFNEIMKLTFILYKIYYFKLTGHVPLAPSWICL